MSIALERELANGQETKPAVRDEAFLILLMVVAAGMVGYLMIRNPNMGGDALRSLLPIHNLIAGKGYTYLGEPQLFMPPGYGVLAYPFYVLTGDIEWSGMLCSAVSYLMIIATSFYVARFLFGRGAGLLASFFVAFCPTLISLSYVNLSDVTFSFFYLLSFWIFVRMISRKDDIREAMLLGIVMGIAYLVRPEMFLVAVLALGALFVFSAREMIQKKGAGVMLSPILATACFLVFLVPYMMFLQRHTGMWTFSGKTATIFIVAGEMVEEGPRRADVFMVEHPEYLDAGNRVNYVEYIRSRGGKFVERIKLNAKAELSKMTRITFHAVAPLVLLIVVSPLFVIGKKPAGWKTGNQKIQNRMLIVSFLIFFSPLPVLLVFNVVTRYLLPYSLLVFILLAFLIVRLVEMASHRVGERFAGWALVAACGVSLASLSVRMPHVNAPSLYETLTERHAHRGLRAAGLWLRGHVRDLDDLSIIAPRKGVLSLFYASGKQNPRGACIDIPINMSLGEVVGIVRGGEADFLVLDHTYIYTRPQLLPLWNDPDMSEGLGMRLVYRDGENLVQIYSAQNEHGSGEEELNAGARLDVISNTIATRRSRRV
ncbi:MAG: hypothetical protein Kow0099_15110 [Candidatus Abyssubacteria bacterium]